MRPAASGTTSMHQRVQATTRSSSPRSASVTVALGCRETTRCGTNSFMTELDYRARERRRSALLHFAGMYSNEVIEHFEHPRNVGELADADVSVEVSNPACGDI